MPPKTFTVKLKPRKKTRPWTCSTCFAYSRWTASPHRRSWRTERFSLNS